MASAVKTKDLAAHQTVLAVETAKKRAINQSETVSAPLAAKKFADLTSQEKDDLLKSLALRFNLIAPD